MSYEFNMVDMGGIDIATVNGTVVAGLYNKLLEGMDACGNLILYNWKFAEIEIVPSACSILIEDEAIIVNGTIRVDNSDVISLIWADPPPVPVEPITITENGVYMAQEPLSGFNPVSVDVPIPRPRIIPIEIVDNGEFTPPGGVDGFAPVKVNVSSSVETYAFIVVDYPAGATCTASNGSVLITAPDTSGHVVFAIPSAGAWTIAYVGSSGQATVSVDILSYGVSKEVSFTFPPGYKEVAYLEIGSSAGPYIDIAYVLDSTCEFEVRAQYTSAPNSNSWLFGAYLSGKQTDVGYTQGAIYLQTGGRNVLFSFDTLQHVYASKQDAFYYDGIAQTGATPNWANTVTTPTKMFYIGNGSYSNNCRIYYLKIWKNGVLNRHFIPCYREADNKPGMYDSVNGVFYTNDGTGEFILGPEV